MASHLRERHGLTDISHILRKRSAVVSSDQPTITSSFALTQARRSVLTKPIANFVAMSGIAFHVIRGEPFQKLLKVFCFLDSFAQFSASDFSAFM